MPGAAASAAPSDLRHCAGQLGPAVRIPDRAARDLAPRRGAQRRPPAEPAREIAEPVQHRSEPSRQGEDARFTPAEPGPVPADDLGEGQALGSGEIERDPRRGGRRKEKQNGRDDVIELHDLERPGIRHHRQYRQRRQAPEQRAAAIGRQPEHDRWAQDHPIEIASHQRLVALPLGPRKRARRLAVDADRRQVDNPPDAGALARREQRADTLGMHAARRVARLILQDTGAIDDRVDAGEAAEPVLGPRRAGDIERHPFRLRLKAARPRRVPGEPANLVTRIEKPGDHGRADQASRPGNQYPHCEHNTAISKKAENSTSAAMSAPLLNQSSERRG